MSRRLQVLFLCALLGVLVLVGVLAFALAGPVAGTVYVLSALAFLGVVAARGQATARPAGRTCTCCTSTVHDPVRVL